MPTLSLEIETPRWALPLVDPKRYKGAKGGRAGGRSHFFAESAVEAMVIDPNLRFVCIREVQRALKHSAKALIEAKIRKLGVQDEFEILTREIRRVGGSGVMVFEGMQDHTADTIKSLEGFGRAWVEEAHTISERSLRILLPTIRAPGSEIWFSWNPDSPSDPVDKFFAGGEGNEDFVCVHSNYVDNPFLPSEMWAEAERLKRDDPDLYEHVWLGGYFLGGSGRVYSSFSKKPFPAGNVDESIIDPGGQLLVGMDFNVNPMSAVVATRAGDECLVLDGIELASSNTQEMADEIRRRYPGRHIVVCPDPAGKQRRSSAPVGVTDFTILERAGFEIRAPRAAPPVVDRLNNSNAMYYDTETGRRRCRIHPDASKIIDAVTSLVYKEETGKRDPRSRFIHICDALDYMLWEEFNVLDEGGAFGIGTLHI